MANRTYDALWAEGIDLLQRFSEPPEPVVSIQSLPAWQRAYVGTLLDVRTLDAAYAGMVHPQRSPALRSALEAALGHLVELWAALEACTLASALAASAAAGSAAGVKTAGATAIGAKAGGVKGAASAAQAPLTAVPSLVAALQELKVSPHELEVPVPTYLVAVRAQELAHRAGLLSRARSEAKAALTAGISPAGGTLIGEFPPALDSGTVLGVGYDVQESASTLDLPQATAQAAAAAPAQGAPQHMASEEAPETLQAAKRSQQAGERVAALQTVIARAEPKVVICKGGKAVDREIAVVCIQAHVRGWQARQETQHAAEREDIFLGLAAQDDGISRRAAETKLLNVRAALRGERAAELTIAAALARARVQELDGPMMRSDMQDKIVKWFMASRDPVTGKFPDLPSEELGGSKDILEPPQAAPTHQPAAKPARKAPAKEVLPATDSEVLPPPPPPPQSVKGGNKTKKGADTYVNGQATGPPPAVGPPAPVAFLAELRAAIAEHSDTWASHSTSSAGGSEARGLAPHWDANLLRAGVLPAVRQELRLQVDAKMRPVLQDLKAKAAEEAATRQASSKMAQQKAAPAQVAKKKLSKGTAGKDGAKRGKEKSKDALASRSDESILEELAAVGVARICPAISMSRFLGSPRLLAVPPPPVVATAAGTAGLAVLPEAPLLDAAVWPAPSLAEVRQALTATAILPLVCASVHAKAPHNKAILLYGASGTGKTMLAHAIAHDAGATLLDLSPEATDGLYPGKKGAALLVQMVFRAAKAFMPSVILVDACQKVFVTDKCKSKLYGGQEPFNRIRKALLKEAEELAPGDRVLLLGLSDEPQACVRKDGAVLRALFGLRICIPLPDQRTRQVIWREMLAEHGVQLAAGFSVNSLAALSECYSPGAVSQMLGSRLAGRRAEESAAEPLTVVEVLQWLSQVRLHLEIPAASSEVLSSIEAWRLESAFGAPDSESESASPSKKLAGKN